MDLICKNKWCRGTFKYNGDENNLPTQCPKCKSFDNELSGGVSWIDKEYEGERWDGMPHITSINVKKYFK